MKRILLIIIVLFLITSINATDLFKLDLGAGINIVTNEKYRDIYKQMTVVPYGKFTLKFDFLDVDFLEDVGVYIDYMYAQNEYEFKLEVDNVVLIEDLVEVKRNYIGIGIEKEIEFKGIVLIPNFSFCTLKIKETGLNESIEDKYNLFKLSLIIKKYFGSKRKMSFFVDINYHFTKEDLPSFNVIGGFSFKLNPFKSRFL